AALAPAMPAGPAPTTTRSNSATGFDAHPRTDLEQTRPLVEAAVDGDPAFVAAAHAAERRAWLAVYGSAEAGNAGIPQRRRYADPRSHREKFAVDLQHDLRHRGSVVAAVVSCRRPCSDGLPVRSLHPASSAAFSLTRPGANAAASIGGGCPRIRSVRIRAVPVAVVIPSPSCPEAIQRSGTSSQRPINGSLSSVAGRNPVQTRISSSSPNPGRKRCARRNISAIRV